MSYPDFTVPLNEIKKPLSQLQLAVERLCIFADDRGAVGDRSTDDASHIQDAIDELGAAGGGILRFTPGKGYVSSVVNLKKNVHIDASGAELIAKSSGNNFLFNIHNAIVSTKTLTTALKDATTIVVNSTSGISVGDAVIVSAGTFTGSGSEHGPCEWNEVRTVTDSTHLVLKSPLKMSYSAMGMTGASPILQVFGPASSLITDVRIANCLISINGTDNPLIFGVSNTQRIEIDRNTFLGKGAELMFIGYSSNVWVHHNIGRGPSKVATGLTSCAGLMESAIEDNWFDFEPAASSGGMENTFTFEVMTRDSVIARNWLQRIDGAPSGVAIAINFPFGSFNNLISENRAFGVNLSNSFETWFSRAFENAGNSTGFGGNRYLANHYDDFLMGIGDVNVGTQFAHNHHRNSTVQSFSTGFVSANDAAQFGPNYLKNIARPEPRDGSTGIIRTQSFPAGDLGFIWGTGSPESVVTAPVGQVYIDRNGLAYYKKTGISNTGWKALWVVGDALTTTDDAYDATSWDGSVEVPTKNAIRDRIEALLAGVSSSYDTLAEIATALGTKAPIASPSFTGNVAINDTWPILTLTGSSLGGAVRLIDSRASGRDWSLQVTESTFGGNGVAGLFAIVDVTADLARLRIDSSGNIRFPAYGAGTLVTDASGNITASSDERLKTNVRPFTRGLADIVKLSPITYEWLPSSGMDSGRYAGFSAQDVQRAIPEAIGQDSRGYLTVSDRPILGALVNSNKELNDRIKALEAKIAEIEKKKGLSYLAGRSIVDQFFNSLFFFSKQRVFKVVS